MELDDNNINKIFIESEHNPFTISEEFSELSAIEIKKAIEFISDYFKAQYRIENKRTFDINKLGKKNIIPSITITLSKNNKKCTIDVSNPLEFSASRYWFLFLKNGRWTKYWTNEPLLGSHRQYADIIFKIFSKDYDWVNARIELVQQKKLRSEKLSADDLIFHDIEISRDEINVSIGIYDEPSISSGKKLSLDQQEELIFKVYERIFDK